MRSTHQTWASVPSGTASVRGWRVRDACFPRDFPRGHAHVNRQPTLGLATDMHLLGYTPLFYSALDNTMLCLETHA